MWVSFSAVRPSVARFQRSGAHSLEGRGLQFGSDAPQTSLSRPALITFFVLSTLLAACRDVSQWLAKPAQPASTVTEPATKTVLVQPKGKPTDSETIARQWRSLWSELKQQGVTSAAVDKSVQLKSIVQTVLTQDPAYFKTQPLLSETEFQDNLPALKHLLMASEKQTERMRLALLRQFGNDRTLNPNRLVVSTFQLGRNEQGDPRVEVVFRPSRQHSNPAWAYSYKAKDLQAVESWQAMDDWDSTMSWLFHQVAGKDPLATEW